MGLSPDYSREPWAMVPMGVGGKLSLVTGRHSMTRVLHCGLSEGFVTDGGSRTDADDGYETTERLLEALVAAHNAQPGLMPGGSWSVPANSPDAEDWSHEVWHLTSTDTGDGDRQVITSVILAGAGADRLVCVLGDLETGSPVFSAAREVVEFHNALLRAGAYGGRP